MKLFNILPAILITIFLSSCASTPSSTMTPLEIQSLQSRDYEAKKDIVFGSVVSVFQDIGYAISNADLQTGLVFAESSTQSDNLAAFFGVAKISHTKATAFIERIGDRTKVRLNFVEVTNSSSGYGQNKKQDRPLLDAKLYQVAHEKIANAVFIRSAN
jgi:hypothetical protein